MENMEDPQGHTRGLLYRNLTLVGEVNYATKPGRAQIILLAGGLLIYDIHFQVGHLLPREEPAKPITPHRTASS